MDEDKAKKDKAKAKEGKPGKAVVKPNLDHYVGRPVEAVIHFGDEDEPSEWAIKFEGGALVKNYDGRRTSPPGNEIVGTTFQAATYTEVDTRLKFAGGAEVSFNPTQYSIADSNAGWEEFPQLPDEEERIVAVPEDEKHAERTQDGPSQEWLDAEEEKKKPKQPKKSKATKKSE